MSGLILAKAQRAQRSKSLRMCDRHLRLGYHSISAAVGVSKEEARRNSTLDDEVSSMRGAVMRRTQDDQSIGVVVSAFRTKPDVMNIEEGSMTATGNNAPPAISSDDMAPNRGWNRLPSAGRSRLVVVDLGRVCVLLGASTATIVGVGTHVGGAGSMRGIVLGT